MADRKNNDYAESAENLTNPQEVIALYHEMQLIQHSLDALNNKLAAVAGDVLDAIAQETATMGKVRRELIAAIDLHGSYQDVENGFYALKQRKISVTYLADKVLQFIPEFAQAVIEQVVNKSKIEGLLKGGLITIARVDTVSIKTETFAYIIK